LLHQSDVTEWGMYCRIPFTSPSVCTGVVQVCGMSFIGAEQGKALLQERLYQNLSRWSASTPSLTHPLTQLANLLPVGTRC
jgi:hypothetical protein